MPLGQRGGEVALRIVSLLAPECASQPRQPGQKSRFNPAQKAHRPIGAHFSWGEAPM